MDIHEDRILIDLESLSTVLTDTMRGDERSHNSKR